MDELVDILDTTGNPTGQTALKTVAHREGLFHATVHIWFYTKNKQLLLQQRAKTKDTHPLLWDVSVAGHVGAGEDIEISAVREIQEEIGLTVSKKDLQKIGVFKSVFKHSSSLIDCEFHHTYLCELKTSLEQLQKQETEVANLDLIPLSKFSEEIVSMSKPGKYVPHDIEYYKVILQEINKKL